jgi:putative transposase
MSQSASWCNISKARHHERFNKSFLKLKRRYWGRHFWAIGYFVRTTGNVTDEMIKAYIEHHGKDDGYGNFQVEY